MEADSANAQSSSRPRTEPLTGTHIRQLQEALLEAFSLDDLTMMVRLELARELSAVVAVQGRTLDIITYDLVVWALHSPGLGLQDLLAAAARTNPENPKIQELRAAWEGVVFKAPVRPYPGMRPFTIEDRDLFYGRSGKVLQAVDALHRFPFLAIIGPSGSGKSSLVAAGILPMLVNSHYFADKSWDMRTVRPGATPYDALVAALAPIVVERVASEPLLDAADGTRLLLVVDQFEEIFTVAETPQRNRFEQCLLGLIQAPDFYLIIAARADFYANLMTSPLWGQISKHCLEVIPPYHDDLRDAITLPATDVGVRLEPALVERLLADAGDEPGVLPFVQETLVMLWSHADRFVIGLDAYTNLIGEKSGRSGLEVALANHAEHVYNDVLANDTERATAQRILLRLIQFGEGRPDTRRQQTVSELCKGSDSSAVFDKVLAVLTANRLVTLSSEARKVDLSHEALIGGWPRLYVWSDNRRTAELIRRRLENNAMERKRLRSEGNGGSGGLLDAVELAEAEAWINGLDAVELGVSGDLLELVRDSRSAVDAVAKEKEEGTRQLQMAADTLRRRNRTLAIALVAALVAIGVAVMFYINAQTSAAEAIRQRVTAEANAARAAMQQSIAEANAAVAEDKTAIAEAEQRKSTANYWATLSSLELDQARPNLLRALQCAQNAVRATYADDGYATVAADQALQHALAAAHRASIAMTFAQQGLSSVSYSPTGKYLVLISGSNRTAALIDLSSRTVVRVLQGHKAFVRSAQFSPNGKSIVTASDDHTIRLWDADTGEEIFVFLGHADKVYDAVFNPDGSQVVSASGDGTVRIWDVVTGRELQRLIGHKGSVYSARFNPDGSEVVSAGDDGTVRIWNVTTGRQQAVFVGDTGRKGDTTAVNFAAFSPDGSRVAGVTGRFTGGNSEFNSYIWPVLSAGQPITLTGHIRAVRTAAFASDGRTRATASDDGTVRIWDVHNGKQIRQFELYDGQNSVYLTDLAYAANDEVIVVVADNGSLTLLDPDIGDAMAAARVTEQRIKAINADLVPKPILDDR